MHTKDIARYQHPHIFHYSGGKSERSTLRVVALTVTMMVVEVSAGWIFNSMALLADGWHMSTHAAALGISWLAFVLVVVSKSPHPVTTYKARIRDVHELAHVTIEITPCGDEPSSMPAA